MINMSSKAKNLIFTVISAALLVVAAKIASFQPKQEIVLEFGMFTGSNWDVENANSFIIIDDAIERFELAHPGVRVHYYSGVLKEDYSEWLSRKLLAGEMPDVFMILGSDYNQFSSIGVLKDLDEMISRDDSFDLDGFYTSSLHIGLFNGRQYALPYETNPTLMFVNKTLLDNEGIDVPGLDWTWDDLYEISKKVIKDTDNDGIIDQFGTYNYTWLNAVFSNGGNLFDENGENSHFTNNNVVEALKFVYDLNELNQGQKVTQEDFNNGEVVFMPLTFAEYRTYKTYPYKIKKYANFQWDCITLPSGPSGENTSQADALLMGISANTNYEALAWEFIKMLTCDEQTQTNIYRYSQGASVLKSVTGSEMVETIIQKNMEEGDTVISSDVLSRVINECVVTPKFKKYEQAIGLAENEISKILDNKGDFDSSLKILQRYINKYLHE